MKDFGSTPGGRAFLLIWAGHLASMLGTMMASFALTVWLWRATGRATSLALVELSSFGAVVLISPVAGVLVDRLRRQVTLMLADAVGALVAVVLVLLTYAGSLQGWHLYAAKLVLGAFQAVQATALVSSIPVLLPSKHHVRANGLMTLALSAAATGAPVLASAALGLGSLSLVLWLDAVSCLAAVLTVWLARAALRGCDLPATRQPAGWNRAALGAGFRLIFGDRSLLRLALFSAISNFLGMFGILLPAMILARTGGDQLTLGLVLGASGVGGMLGALGTAALPGRGPLLRGAMWGFLALGLLGQAPSGLGRSALLWATAAFLSALIFPFVQACVQAIWQSQVHPSLQGRVHGARRLLAEITGPAALLLAGPLADQVFEPLMRNAAVPWWWPASAWLGQGPGSGMAFLLFTAGVLQASLGFVGLRSRVLAALDARPRG